MEVHSHPQQQRETRINAECFTSEISSSKGEEGWRQLLSKLAEGLHYHS